MKNDTFFIIAAIVFLSVSVWAEEPPEQAWVARYNGTEDFDDEGRALVVDSSGNVYVTGFSKDASGTYDDYVTIKYDPNGNQLWATRYDGPVSGDDLAWALAIDNSGNVYVTGYSTVGYSYNYDCATIKYDPNGNQLWVARYNGLGNSMDQARALVIDNRGNVYVTGPSVGSGGDYDYATIKYIPGRFGGISQLWVARYNGPGNDFDWASAIALDNLGNVYVTGSSWGSGTQEDCATIKYSPNGNQLWVARYNGPANGQDRAYAVAVDNSGNVYVTGYSYGSDTDPDCVTIKYDPNGNQLWVARYNGPGNSSDETAALAIDSSGNVYVTGSSYGAARDCVTIKYDPNGNQLWVARYSGPGNSNDEAYDLAIDSSGNVYVTGYSVGSDTDIDYVTIKYSPNGNQLWVKRYNGPGNDFDWAWALAIDNSGNVYVTGGSYDNGTGRDYVTIKYTQHDYCLGPITGDFNNDCSVDFTDFAIIAEEWLESRSLADLAEVIEDWLGCNFAFEEDCF